MTTLAPGFYVANVRGREGVTVVVTDSDYGYPCISVGSVNGQHTHMRSQVVNARPLVVLDLACWAPTKIEGFPEWLRSAAGKTFDVDWHFVKNIADQIQAQTKPAHIPEPGKWGVVRDEFGADWTRFGPCQVTSQEWQSENGDRCDWLDIESPVEIRAGVEA